VISTVLLHDHWELELDAGVAERLGAAAGSVHAVVPGCVHTDLMAAGLIADPTLGLNEVDQHWIGESDWTYRLAFDAVRPAAEEQLDLVFDGLDTFATVVLNGVEIGRTANQHRRYRFDVGDAIVDGVNSLVVTFASPVAVALDRRRTHGDLPNPYGTPYNFVRKMASNFGWDWGPQLTTSGIWRPVRLERWSTARVESLRLDPLLAAPKPVPGESGRLEVVLGLCGIRGTADPTCTVAVRVEADDGTLVASHTTESRQSDFRASIDVPRVQRWCPIGRGPQPLYTVVIEISDGSGIVDRAARRVGFRHVELDTTPDSPDSAGEGATGSTFAFVVNGERVWIRGFNWITDDCFASNVTAERLAFALDEAVALNANLVRVWGGGIYEDDAFYELCDERGILVWQDFLFSCAAYPEELLEAEVRAEAADNVERLMSHPSLLVWNANNENLWGWADWDWKDSVGERTWGDGFYHRVLPEVVAALDPHRIYLDGSPTSLDQQIHPNDPDHGLMHIWDVWNDLNYPHYRDHDPRFASEFGFQAPATWRTMIEGMGTETPEVGGPELRHRQRALDGHAKLDRWLTESFEPPHDFDDWLYSTQIIQARAATVGLTRFRSQHERCSGVIWWQLNDCWPGITWSVLDSGGRRKPSWYATRDALDPRLVAVAPTETGCTVSVVNDTTERWCGRLEIVRTTQGRVTGSQAWPFDAAADSAQSWSIDDPALVPTGQNDLLVVSTSDRRAVHQPQLRSADARPQYDVDVRPSRDGVTITVAASTLVRELCVFADRVDPHAVCDRQLITLLPGEVAVIEVVTRQREAGVWRDALDVTSGRSTVLRTLGDRTPGRDEAPVR